MPTKISGLLSDYKKSRHQLYSIHELIHEVHEYRELDAFTNDFIPLTDAQPRKEYYKAKIDLIISDEFVGSDLSCKRGVLSFGGFRISRIIITSLRKKIRFDIDIASLPTCIYHEGGAPMLLVYFHPDGDIRVHDSMSPAMYSISQKRQRIPRTLRVPAGTTVSEILEMAELKSWIPDGGSLNIGPAPDSIFVRQFFFDADGAWIDEEQKANAVESSWSVGEPRSNWTCPIEEHIEFHYWEHKPWVQYHRKQEPEQGWASYIPLNEVPADGSILAIPMKGETDRQERDCMDDFRLCVQIRHTTKP